MGKSPVMLIRHAKSLSNIGGNYLHKEAEASEKGLPLEKWLSVFGDEKLIDSKLCDEGIDQCIIAGTHLASYNFK